MATHNIKCWPEPFQAIWDGKKTHEWRRNDRAYQVGDALQLHEWRPEQGQYDGIGEYTGRQLRVLVTYVTPGGQFGIPQDYCVMSVRVP